MVKLNKEISKKITGNKIKVSEEIVRTLIIGYVLAAVVFTTNAFFLYKGVFLGFVEKTEWKKPYSYKFNLSNRFELTESKKGSIIDVPIVMGIESRLPSPAISYMFPFIKNSWNVNVFINSNNKFKFKNINKSYFEDNLYFLYKGEIKSYDPKVIVLEIELLEDILKEEIFHIDAQLLDLQKFYSFDLILTPRI